MPLVAVNLKQEKLMKTAMTRRGQARMVLAMLGVMWTALPCATASAQRDRDGDPERARRLGGVPREVALEVTAV